MRVMRRAEDGFSQQVWEFGASVSSGRVCLVLTRYSIERRKQSKGRFAKAPSQDRWDSMDERHYYSGLPRPTSIPAGIIDEALAQLPVSVQVGGTSEERCLATVRITLA